MKTILASITLLFLLFLSMHSVAQKKISFDVAAVRNMNQQFLLAGFGYEITFGKEKQEKN